MAFGWITFEPMWIKIGLGGVIISIVVGSTSGATRELTRGSASVAPLGKEDLVGARDADLAAVD